MSALPNFHAVESPEHFQTLLSADLARVSLINFWAPWAEPCVQMNEVVQELAKKYPQVLVLQVEADEQQDISESFDIEAVPSFIILRGHTLLARISGADAPGLTKALAAHAAPAPAAPTAAPGKAHTQPPPPASETPEELEQRIRRLMAQSKVVLFMKGTPDAPRCGFSRRTVALLREQSVEFTSFDVLEDEAVRQGLKKLNNWPTIPQLIVNGELIGGLDIFTEMVENGEFAEIMAAS